MKSQETEPEQAARTPAILVAHTHWDREWYLTVEQLRPRLVRLFDNLQHILETEAEYHSFWLDGQTIALEDYWQTSGEKPAWLEKALFDRKILIGPWYTLVDEWLSSGEAMIRNLFQGRRLMNAYGQDNRIGYLPDSFGHISQMPAILAGFGIHNALMYRGIVEGQLPCLEFEWISVGGQRVLGIHLLDGYFNAQRIDVERHLAGPGLERFVDSIRELEPRAATGVLLLMNGVDQALPTPRLSQSIRLLETRLPDLHIRHAGLADYLALVQQHLGDGTDLPAIQGELPDAPKLDATLSAQVEQKIANRFVENLLTYYVEPLLVLVHPERRHAYRGSLRRVWALVTQCHAHDSICSCHSDLVAADVMNRLSRARQLGESLEQELFVEILGTRPAEQPVQLPSTLVLRNPLPWEHHDPMEVTLYVPAGSAPNSLVFEQEGEIIPSHILSVEETCRWTEHYYGKVYNKAAGTPHLRALIQPRLEAGAFAAIHVRSKQNPLPTGAGEASGPGHGASTSALPSGRRGILAAANTLDNGIIRVIVYPDGRFDLTELATGFHAGSLNRLQDEVDRGDLYEHARAVSGRTHSPRAGAVCVIEESPLRAVLQIESEIECNGIACPLELRIGLAAGSRLVSVAAALDNRAQDHWLRTTCPFPGDLKQLRVHTPFDLVARGLQDGEPYVEGDRVRFQQRLGQPMRWGLFAQTDQSLLGVFNRGLYEYIYETGGQLSISLMRFVGLIREDLISYPARGANRPGVQHVEYAVGLWPQAELPQALRAMHEYNLPPHHIQIFDQPPPLPRARLRWSNPNWMLSAWKPAEEGEATVLRFWNASGRSQEGALEVAGGLEGAMRCRLDETPIGPLPDTVVAGPKEIVSILLPHEDML